MRNTKKKRVVITLVALLVLFIYAIAMRFQSRFVVENRTGQTIQQVQIDICNQTYTFTNIPAGGSVWTRYYIAGDGGYDVLAKLQDGTKIEGLGGYVTDGFYGARDRITIKSNRQVGTKQNYLCCIP